MKAKFLLGFVGILALCLASQIALAQGSRIKVVVDFTNPVNVGNGQVLQPGQYTFNMESDQTDRDVFRVQGQDGKNVTVSGVSFDQRKEGSPVAGSLPNHTAVILENIDGTYYLHRIRMAGENRGFEFQLPKDVKDKTTPQTEVVVDAAGGQSPL